MLSTLVPAIGFGIVTASILAVAGVGFTLQLGVTNILNLAYGDIMTAAAFARCCWRAGSHARSG
jgi:branched-subunit amino acid ABC-type transport system permease component